MTLNPKLLNPKTHESTNPETWKRLCNGHRGVYTAFVSLSASDHEAEGLDARSLNLTAGL